MAVLKIEELAGGPGWAHLKLDGEIDLDTVDQLRDELVQLQNRGVCHLALHMAGTQWLNSSALAELVKFAERFRELGGGIDLACLNRRVKVPIEMLGLHAFFSFHESWEEAQAAIPPQSHR